MRSFFVGVLVCAALCACSGTRQASSAASPAGSPAAPASPAASAAASPAASASSAAPAPSGEQNLLAISNGTIVRQFPAGAQDPGGAGDETLQWSANGGGPYTFVFELPGQATIDRFSLDHPNVADSGATVLIEGATAGPNGPFTALATLPLKPDTADPSVVQVHATARWLRLNVQSSSAGPGTVKHLQAFGTLAARPRSASLDGVYQELKDPYATGAAFNASPAPGMPQYVFTQAANSANAQQCNVPSGIGATPHPGTFDGRAYDSKGDTAQHWVANDEGSLLVGDQDGNPVYLARISNPPNDCKPSVADNGPHNVLMIDQPAAADPAYLYPVLEKKNVPLPPYRFTQIQSGWLTSALLASTDTVVFNMICNPDGWFDDAQKAALLQWVAAGHKLILHDADLCQGTTHYEFMPYPFITSNPGARAANGRLLLVLESDTLGSTDRSDSRHFIDTAAYLADKNNQQIGDANVVTTKDPHWCGHLFGSNIENVNGFMQMYARYGKGLIIYDGLDHNDYPVPAYQRIVKLELDQPVNGDLPCTRSVASPLLLIPDRSLKFVAGRAQTLTTQMEVYANQKWSGHVTLSASGSIPALITPSAFDLSGNERAITVNVKIPSTAKPGTYPILVSAQAAGESAPPAESTVTVAATSSIAAALATQTRVRLYGIHFDVDSATIQPQSEETIAQIAQAMQKNPSLRFRVEGYTDSDGGYDHNLVLSQNRAASVVNDLVTRYHIASSRLVPKGFGMNDPVASNATLAGKALNRRVELVRI
jgi:outer membrane protein OmpA-like peptidoglycan-associated protein